MKDPTEIVVEFPINTRSTSEIREFVEAVFEEFPIPVALIGEDGAVSYYNRSFQDFMPKANIGSKLGPCLGCENLPCGEGQTCRFCGVDKAIRLCFQSGEASHDCRITRRQKAHEEYLVFRIWARLLLVGRDKMALATFIDMSHEAGHKALERTFFHDILNLVSGLTAIHDMLATENTPIDSKGLLKSARNSTWQLLGEIQSQQMLLAAERRDLAVIFKQVPVDELLREVVDQYKSNPMFEDKTLKVLPKIPSINVETDPVLLRRVVGNMVKNGLEASPNGDPVNVGCQSRNGRVRIWVHNKSVMSPNVQHKVFLKSFSTKGRSRGLGTYSMKLLTERYLGGKVKFSSAIGQGTIFSLYLPKDPKITLS